MNQEIYLKGFVEKCAQYGVTQVDQIQNLIKLAQNPAYTRGEQAEKGKQLAGTALSDEGRKTLQKEYDIQSRVRNTIANLIESQGKNVATYGLSGTGGVLGGALGHALANKDTTSQLLGILGGGAVGSLAGYGGSQLLPDKWETSLANLIGIMPKT